MRQTAARTPLWLTESRTASRYCVSDKPVPTRLALLPFPELTKSACLLDLPEHGFHHDFRQMKDPTVVSFSPMFHFTEQKIRVHIFYCVLALMVARLIVREADRAGLHLSVRALLSSLAGIEETVLLYQGERGRPRARRMLTEIDATQSRLYDLFGLAAYAPQR